MKRNNFISNLTAKSLAGVAVWALVLIAPSVGRATVVFSNLAGGLTKYNTSDGNTVGFDPVFSTDDAEGDTFLGTGLTFSNLQIAINCVAIGACPDNITVALTANNGGQPGATIESFTVAGGSIGIFGGNALVNLSSVLHPVLSNGTRYWITVEADLNDALAWNLNSTGDTSAEANSQDGGASWFSPSGFTPGAFEVDGTANTSAPEPGTAALLVSGGLLLGLFRRVRSQRNQ